MDKLKEKIDKYTGSQEENADGSETGGWKSTISNLGKKLVKKLKEKSKKVVKKVLEKIVDADGTKTVDEMIREAEAEEHVDLIRQKDETSKSVADEENASQIDMADGKREAFIGDWFKDQMDKLKEKIDKYTGSQEENADGSETGGWKSTISNLGKKLVKKLKEKSKKVVKKVLEKIVDADGTKTVDEMIREAEAEEHVDLIRQKDETSKSVADEENASQIDMAGGK